MMSNQEIYPDENHEEASEHNNDPQEEVAIIQGVLNELPNELLASVFVEKMKDPSFGRIFHTQEVSQQFSGPIPPPSVLNDYEKITPGFADRIITMAEKEQGHRHNLESKALSSGISVQSRGQKYALIICLSIVFGSINLINNGHEISGAGFAGTSLVGLAYVFITGRKNEESEAEDDENKK